MTAIATVAAPSSSAAGPAPEHFETIDCPLCGSIAAAPFISAVDDLTGKPGRFQFVKCQFCGLRYQNPRLTVEHIKAYYDDEYIAHRKKSDWGVMSKFFNWVMDRHDRQKDALVSRFIDLNAESEVLDVGCAVGTFLKKVHDRHGSRVTGVDFADLSAHPALADVDFRCGLFNDENFGATAFRSHHDVALSRA